jgi:hypothetical protein
MSLIIEEKPAFLRRSGDLTLAPKEPKIRPSLKRDPVIKEHPMRWTLREKIIVARGVAIRLILTLERSPKGR